MTDYMLLVNTPQGQAKEVIETAERAGSKGATILPGIMATILEQPVRLDKEEPLMETVLILAPEALAETLIAEIEALFIGQKEHNGSIFVTPVSQVIGTTFDMSAEDDRGG